MMAIDRSLQNYLAIAKWATNDAALGVIEDQLLSIRHQKRPKYKFVGEYLWKKREIDFV